MEAQRRGADERLPWKTSSQIQLVRVLLAAKKSNQLYSLFPYPVIQKLLFVYFAAADIFNRINQLIGNGFRIGYFF